MPKANYADMVVALHSVGVKALWRSDIDTITVLEGFGRINDQTGRGTISIDPDGRMICPDDYGFKLEIGELEGTTCLNLVPFRAS